MGRLVEEDRIPGPGSLVARRLEGKFRQVSRIATFWSELGHTGARRTL